MGGWEPPQIDGWESLTQPLTCSSTQTRVTRLHGYAITPLPRYAYGIV